MNQMVDFVQSNPKLLGDLADLVLLRAVSQEPPTLSQIPLLASSFGAVRYVYNTALSYRSKAYKRRKESINYYDSVKLLNILKKATLMLCCAAFAGAAEALAQEAIGQTHILIAHRGGKYEVDENTIDGFSKAYAAGVRAYETDFRMTKDGVVVINHDATLKRMFNVDKTVESMTIAEVRELKTAKGKPVLKKSYSVLQDDFFQYMREAGYADVERGERGSSEEHLTVTQFKVEREQARLADLQTEKSEVQAEIGKLRTDKAEAEKAAKEAQTELRLLAPKLKHMEKLAAEYSSDPEDLLPLPDRMESAKSYREKKSKPLLEKIVKVVRSVYRAYLDVCQKFELLQRKYDTEVPYLKSQLAEVRGENAELQETARDYHRLCRAYGPERVAETVATVKQQERAEKERNRSQNRRHDRDAR